MLEFDVQERVEAEHDDSLSNLQSVRAGLGRGDLISFPDIEFETPQTNRMQGERQHYPGRVNYCFCGDQLFASFSIDYTDRSLAIKFEVGRRRDDYDFDGDCAGDGSPVVYEIDPKLEKTAAKILKQVRAEYEGMTARLLNFLSGKRCGVDFEGPYTPAGTTALILDIRVKKEQNIDHVYNHIRELLESHPLNEDRARLLLQGKVSQGKSPYHRYDISLALTGSHAWTEAEMDVAERSPKRYGLSTEAESADLDGINPDAGSVINTDETPSLVDAEINSDQSAEQIEKERYRQAVLARHFAVRSMTPAGWAAQKALNQFFRVDPTASSESDDDLGTEYTDCDIDF